MSGLRTDAAGKGAEEAYRREVLQFDEWRRQLERDGEGPAIPAATVVVLHDGPAGLESLMLRRNSRLAFGGMWVFPGGRIDDADHDGAGDLVAAARNAAAREAREEAAIVLDPADLVHFSCWIPPPLAPKRFATWFFAARAPSEDVSIDEGEIVHHEWMTPQGAMRRRDAGEIELVAPTWVTLRTVGQFDTVAGALEGLARRRARRYETRIGRGGHGPVSLWHGDAGYETADPSVPGPRHRLEITPNGYLFDESGYSD
ncbi:MAG: NUDIX domain-containing protein [Acidimicrobiaceae bacterium]|nr:NUDIX domain-containing protein [Acidimicrobiaceae bacterium]MYE97238.1 NUDIX domain-containing protein [Acidimicrobiaceae bacterium]MYH44958.1 NUDIX domain-containing protein [Acidimicrobiaceae bacterium]MYI54471.1 NUDIX domain-containing protein [Acidimicrobiaceae bacterium]MYK74223.1 NUDIX domain-containing protein [Acidimicrobiaceae bacterium]